MGSQNLIASRTRQWRGESEQEEPFTTRKESSLEQCRTSIQWNWKTDQWTNRDHWCEHYSIQRTYVDVDKLTVQPSFSVLQCQNLRLLRLCTLCGKWEMILVRPGKNKSYSENNHFKEMNRIDGMPTEFEWKMFPGITTLSLLEQIQEFMKERQCDPEHFKDRVIFMSMYNDIEWAARGYPKIRAIVRRPEIIHEMFWSGVEVCRKNYYCTLGTEKGQGLQHFCREYTKPRNERGTRVRSWIYKNTRFGRVWDIKVCSHDERCSIEVLVRPNRILG